MAILALQQMAWHDDYPDDITYRLIADACATGFHPERAVDLMVRVSFRGDDDEMMTTRMMMTMMMMMMMMMMILFAAQIVYSPFSYTCR